MANPPMLSPVFQVAGNVLQYKPYPSYPTWIDAWDISALVPSDIEDMELFELPFTFDSTYPLILVVVPALATITSVRLHIDETFDVPTTIQVGDADVPDRLMTAQQNNPFEAGIYEVEPDYEYSDITTLVLLVDATGATAGAGRILIQYEE